MKKFQKKISMILSIIMVLNSCIFVGANETYDNESLQDEIVSASSLEIIGEEITPGAELLSNNLQNLEDEAEQSYYQGHTYQIFDDVMTWSAAEEYCENLGGHLATITSSGEQNYIAGLLSSPSKSYYWLGASDAEAEGTWKWVTNEEWSYSVWAGGEPNDEQNEDYLHLYSDNKQWNDLNIDASIYYGLSNFGFICEWDDIVIGSMTPAANTTITGRTEFSVSLEAAQSVDTVELYYAPINSSTWTLFDENTYETTINEVSFDVNVSLIGNGTYKFKIVVTDESANSYNKIFSPYTIEIDRYEYGNSQYKVFNEAKTWSEAKEYCETLGGHLVTITSSEEQSFIANTLLSSPQKIHYWLGATDEVNEGIWNWVTGEEWSYSNWGSGQPDNWNNEDYLHLSLNSCQWNDLNINSVGYGTRTQFSDFGFICEWETAGINSISPTNNSTLAASPTFRVSASDNRQLTDCSVYYKSSGTSAWTLIESKALSSNYTLSQFTWDTTNLTSGSYDVKFVVTNTLGTEYIKIYNYNLQNLQPSAAVLTGTAGNLSANLSWTNADSDISYYKIYRGRTGESYRYLGRVETTSYTDTDLSSEITYNYYVVSVNQYGNSSTSNIATVTPNFVDTVAPVANAGFDMAGIINESISFTGSNSSDNVGITSYLWSFGDGTTSTEANPTHTYTTLKDETNEDYDYTATLTVTDAAGNSSSSSITVTVYPNTQIGTLNLTVKGSDGRKLSNAYVFIDLPGTGQKIYMTNSSGIATLKVMAGNYNISAYYQGYVPNEGNFAVTQYTTTSATLTLTKSDLVTQEVVVTPMTRDEIIDAGIDTSDPDNQYVYSITTTLVFEQKEITLPPVVTSGTGTVYSGGSTYYYGGGSSTPSTTPSSGTSQTVIVPKVIVNEDHPEVPPTLAYLVIPSTVSWLKEFFNVQMILINQAPEAFVIQDSVVTLSLPEGLSLANTATPQTLTVDLGDISGQSTATAEWIIRGDVSGTYDLDADFTGVLMPFEADVSASFQTEEAITVYGEKALKVYIYPEDTAFIGEKYYVDYVLQNQSNNPLYDFSLTFGMDGETVSNAKTYTLEDEADQQYLPYLHAGDTVSVDELSAGGSIRGTYETTIDFEGDPSEVYYSLIDTIVSHENTDLGVIPVEVVPVESSKMTANAIGAATFKESLGTLIGQKQTPISITYNSLSEYEGMFGLGWLFNYDYRIEQTDGKYALVMPDGTKYFFKPDYTIRGELTDDEVTVNVNTMLLSGYTPITRGAKNFDLTVTANGYTVTTANKTVYTFDTNGLLVDITDKTGYGYDIDRTSNTYEITEKASGRSTTLTLDANGYVSQMTGTNGTYLFNYSSGKLSSITEPDSILKQFTYTSDKLSNVNKSKGNLSLDIFDCEYSEDGYLSKITDNLGKSRLYNYDKNSEFWRIIVDETDRLGYHRITKFNRFGELVSDTDALGHTTLYTYDHNGNRTSIIDPNENTVIYTYDTADNLTKITDALERETVYTYDPNTNNLLTETDANGKTITYTYYPTNNKVHTVTDKNGNVTTYTYDNKGNLHTESINNYTKTNTYNNDSMLESEEDFNGNVTTYTYNANKLVSKVTDALGGETSYTYDDAGRQLSITYPDRKTEQWYYNSLGNLEVYTDRRGVKTAYGYNDNNDLIMITADYTPNGNNNIISRYYYDDEQELIKVTDFDGNDTLYAYDGAGQLTSETDGNGNETVYTYDPAGRLLSETKDDAATVYTYYKTGELKTATDAENNTTTYSYDNMGNVTTVRNALGNSTLYEYDNNGNLKKVTTPEGRINSYTYDFRNNVHTFTDARNNTVTYSYDPNGNRTKDDYGNNIEVRYSYDELNRLEAAVDANGNRTEYSYDEVGNVTYVEAPNNITVHYEYDENGNIEKVYDSNNVKIQDNEYDHFNNLTSTKDALNNEHQYTYNAIGEMMSHTTPRNKTYQYEYDGNSNLKKETDPMGGIVQYTYNAFDEVTSFKDANNNTTSYSLDKLNRLTSETDAANGSDDYTYNAIGLLTQYTNKRGQNITYAYDRDGRRTGRTTVEGATAYTYDPNGNLLTVTDSSGTITRTYDSLNRVTSYTNANDQTIGYEYDAFGNLKKLTYPDNKQVSYTYNANNQMTKVKDWNNRETNYAYDNNGRLSSITRPDGSVETYTYNAAGQLTLAEDKNANNEIINRYQYSYDADGNITDEISANEPDVNEISVDDAAMSYSEANRLTNFNGTPIPYDADGNMLKTPLGSEFGNITFDSLNQLTDVTISGSAISYSYTYDAEGYRTSKTENGTTTNFVVDSNAELSRVLMSTTNGETTYYVYGLGLISEETGATYRLYHYDYRGSTTAMTTLGGAVVDTMFYDAYGNVVKRTGADDIPFLYVGKYGVETDENGLFYMRARYYNPQIQRFINVDPIRDGYNWYNYCNGVPIGYIDPKGLDWYIFYDPTFFPSNIDGAEKEAINLSHYITDKTGKNVWRVKMSTLSDFKERWDRMGTHNNEGSIDGVIVIAHGNKDGFRLRKGYNKNDNLLSNLNLSDSEYKKSYSRTDFMDTDTFRNFGLNEQSMDYFILTSCSPAVDEYDDLVKSKRAKENIAMGISRSPQGIGALIAGNNKVINSTSGNSYLNTGNFKKYSWDSDINIEKLSLDLHGIIDAISRGEL